MRVQLLTALIGATTSLITMSAHAALVSTDGGLGVYDSTYNVTWTSNGNLMETQAANYSGGTSAFVAAMIADSGGVINYASGVHTLSSSDFDVHNGTMSWWGARAWVNYLNATSYGGTNQWALPTTVDSVSNVGNPDGAPGDPAQNSSQLAELFYGSLGQVSGMSIVPVHNSNYSLFSNFLGSPLLWSGTEYSAYPGIAWAYNSFYGSQGNRDEDGECCAYTAMAVAPGELTAVPLPSNAWLMLSGLGGLAAIASKRRTLRLQVISAV